MKGPGRTLGALAAVGLIAMGGWMVDQHLRPPLAIPAATPPALRPGLGLVKHCPAWAMYQVPGAGWFCESYPYPRAGTNSPPCLGPGPSDRVEDREERRDKHAAAVRPRAHENKARRRREFQFRPEVTRCRPGLASSS